MCTSVPYDRCYVPTIYEDDPATTNQTVPSTLMAISVPSTAMTTDHLCIAVERRQVQWCAAIAVSVFNV